MMDTAELLARLEARGVRNVEIARTLDLPDSRVPEIKDRRRALKLDEAAKLVQAFGLEPDRAAPPLPPSVLRLVVRYIADELGVDIRGQEAHLSEIAEDVRAFAEFVADPKVRESTEAAETFFRAMKLRRPGAEARGRSENDHEPTQ